MTRRFQHPSALRIVAAILVAAVGLVAQSAPTPDGGGRCSACGAMGANAGAAGAAASNAACCCCTEKGQSHLPSNEGKGGGPAPCSCPECCLPQARAAAAADDGRAIGAPAPLAFGLVEPPVAAPPAGVHVSVFHPPRP